MSAPDLSEHLVLAGQELLAALDRAGLAAQGAGWVYFHDLGDWRFVVATSLVETMGRSRVYKMLLCVMEQIETPEDLTVEDIHLISTDSPFYKTVGMFCRVETGGLLRISNCTINGQRIDAVIYRWGVAAPSVTEKKEVEKAFRQKVKELSG